MKYICSVKDGDLIRHVIETTTGNVEVTYGRHNYNKYDSYLFKGVEVREGDFNIDAHNKPFSTILLACELVKFIREGI